MIDYGRGKTNIDTKTGIRYGVIQQNSILQAWADSSVPLWGEPHCPRCGNELSDTDKTDDDQFTHCGKEYYEYDCCGEEPRGFEYTDAEYIMQDCLDTEVMVLKSPFYTYAAFCSPCVPGAGDLNSPRTREHGIKAYCPDVDWFEDSPPFDIYRVKNDERIYTFAR